MLDKQIARTVILILQELVYEVSGATNFMEQYSLFNGSVALLFPLEGNLRTMPYKKGILSVEYVVSPDINQTFMQFTRSLFWYI